MQSTHLLLVTMGLVMGETFGLLDPEVSIFNLGLCRFGLERLVSRPELEGNCKPQLGLGIYAGKKHRQV